jgi:large subunit ribosomal protein L3
MTSIFSDKGQVVPVTVIEAGPMVVVQVKTMERDGYAAVQLGFGEKKQQRAKKPELGHVRKAGTGPKKVLREVRVPAAEIEQYRPGQTIALAEMGFAAGDFVDVIGTSKGKGYQGVMKRHHFKGYSGSHGAHEYKRHGGSIGSSAAPSRVFKGMGMAGHMGNQQATLQNLKVVEVRPEQNLLLIQGSVPGHNDALLLVKLSKKKGKKTRPAA